MQSESKLAKALVQNVQIWIGTAKVWDTQDVNCQDQSDPPEVAVQAQASNNNFQRWLAIWNELCKMD